MYGLTSFTRKSKPFTPTASYSEDNSPPEVVKDKSEYASIEDLLEHCRSHLHQLSPHQDNSLINPMLQKVVKELDGLNAKYKELLKSTKASTIQECITELENSFSHPPLTKGDCISILKRKLP